jgi:hypothetical protein
MKMKILWVTLALVAAVACASLTDGQIVGELIVNIPYQFTVEGKQCPPGSYTIERTTSEGILVIRSAELKTAIQAPILTRISQSEVVTEPRIVLDKYEGDRYELSEVYFPEMDGYLLVGTKPTPHKHEMIKAKRNKG